MELTYLRQVAAVAQEMELVVRVAPVAAAATPARVQLVPTVAVAALVVMGHAMAVTVVPTAVVVAVVDRPAPRLGVQAALAANMAAPVALEVIRLLILRTQRQVRTQLNRLLILQALAQLECLKQPTTVAVAAAAVTAEMAVLAVAVQAVAVAAMEALEVPPRPVVAAVVAATVL